MVARLMTRAGHSRMGLGGEVGARGNHNPSLACGIIWMSLVGRGFEVGGRVCGAGRVWIETEFRMETHYS